MAALSFIVPKKKELILMANKKNRPVPPKKKKTEKRVIWVRVMAILLALLLAGSVLGVIFTTTAV